MSDYTVYSSPVGTAAYARLNTPDVYKKKGKAQGKPKYSVTLVLDESEPSTQKFTDFLDVQMEEARAALECAEDHPPYGPFEVKNQDTGQYEAVEGKIAVPFSVIAEMQTRRGEVWNRKPTFYDVNGEVYEEEPQIGSGSVIAINFQIWQREAFSKNGIGLQPTEVQVVKLVAPSSGAKGFEARTPEGGGFGSGASAPSTEGTGQTAQAKPQF